MIDNLIGYFKVFLMINSTPLYYGNNSDEQSVIIFEV